MIRRIDEIAVPPRGAGGPDFERDRMVSILDAISHDRTLPPIEVVEAISNLYGHRLYHGPPPVGRLRRRWFLSGSRCLWLHSRK